MPTVDRIIPDLVFSWSLQFKTLVLIAGAVILLFSSFIRPETSIVVWGPLFLFGGLIEWLIVATVYLEMEELENEIEQTYDDVKTAEKEIIETRDKVETAWMRLQALANETYDIQGSTDQFNSLEPGGHSPPEEEDFHSYTETPEERIDELERKLERLERKLR